jgi:hypothetical protein
MVVQTGHREARSYWIAAQNKRSSSSARSSMIAWEAVNWLKSNF